MSIALTSTAASEVRQLLRGHDLDEKTSCLRVGVKGLGPKRQFTLVFAEPDSRETLVESEGIRICFNPADQAKLQGVTIGFRDAGGVRGFTFEFPSTDVSRQERTSEPSQAPPSEQQARDALRSVIDPEVGINIVDLGLVYGVTLHGRNLRVIMTMTTPACPLGEHIRNEVQSRILAECPCVQQVEVELVWDPPWSPGKISPEGKRALGWAR